ncbi:AP-1 complex subunit beta [Bienertia sinuspersici]
MKKVTRSCRLIHGLELGKLLSLFVLLLATYRPALLVLRVTTTK